MRATRSMSVLLLAVASACSSTSTSTVDTTAVDTSAVPTATTAAPPESSAPITPPTTGPDTPSSAAPTTAAVPPSSSEPIRLVDVRVYFLVGERLDIGHRDVAAPAVVRGAVEALLAGPDDGEQATAIPNGTRLLGVDLDDGIATIDLSGEFESGGGSMSMVARIAQVVFTATQFDNVDAVRFRIDGAPTEFLGGEGVVVSDPWTRAMVPRDLAGAVIIDTPRPGETVRSPFTVTGEADVFEAQFPIEIRRDGETIAMIAPVTGGAWGMWGDFAVTISVDATPGPIEVVAYDEGGCGDDPECPPVVETVVRLELAG